MYRYRRRRRTQYETEDTDSPVEGLLRGIAGLYVLALAFLYFIDRSAFWEWLGFGVVALIVVILAARTIRNFLDRRRQEVFQALLARIKDRGFEQKVLNFIIRCGRIREDGRIGFDHRGYTFASDRLRDLQDEARTDGLDFSGEELFQVLHYYIERDEKRLTQESIKTSKQYTLENLSGAEFEQVLYRLFRAMGYAVQLTGRSGDQGGDLVANKDAERILIQAKRWEAPVGNSAVQEAFTAKKIYDCHEARVISAGSFAA